MRLALSTAILALFALAAPGRQGVQSMNGGSSKGKNPSELDRTGVPWCGSFEEALERARGERRLLFLMPDNFAPSEDGEWTHEVFRAGPLSDERISGLLRQRFVCFYFNTFQETAAYDEQAKAFVAREKKEFGKEEQVFPGGMPLLLMTPEGELAGEVSPYTSCDEVLMELSRVLKKNAAYNGPSEAEKASKEPLERARQLAVLQELAAAESLLRKEKSPEALLLRLRIARLSGEWKKHKKLVADLDGEGLAHDAALERAHGLCHEKEFAEAAEVLAAAGDASERSDEARYLEGVALFRSGKRDQALAAWKALIESRPQGPWIYRADWAYVNVLSGDAGAISGSYDGACPSLLGREFYVGPKNPDLGI